MAAKIRNVALIAIGILVSAAAMAQDNGFYIGGSGGQGRPNWDTAGSAMPGVGVDSSNSAWKVFGGYQFNKNVGLEASYVSLGTFNISSGSSIDLYGAGVAVVGTLPLGKDFSLLGRGGVNRMRERINGGNADNTTSPTFGVGVKYDITTNWNARVEAERILRMGSSNTTISSDANLYTLGIGYKF